MNQQKDNKQDVKRMWEQIAYYAGHMAKSDSIYEWGPHAHMVKSYCDDIILFVERSKEE